MKIRSAEMNIGFFGEGRCLEAIAEDEIYGSVWWGKHKIIRDLVHSKHVMEWTLAENLCK
jgi:hypothetical protein